MPTIEETRELIQRSRRVADNADFLSIALASGDEGRIEVAVDDLVDAYDTYAGQAGAYSERFAFDEVAALSTAVERDQSAANGLASALIDLEMALVLTQAAQAAGEIEGQVSAADVDEAVTTLNETLQAVAGAPGAEPGMIRFGFDEVVAAAAPLAASPDLPTAKANFEKQVQTLYELLLQETATMIAAAFDQVSELDETEIAEALNTVRHNVPAIDGGRLVPRILSAVQRAMATLKELGGPQLLVEIDARVQEMVQAVRKGDGAVQPFLRYIYQCDEGQQEILQLLQQSQSSGERIDGGRHELADLQQQVMQTFSVSRRMIIKLRQLGAPIEWILQRLPGPGTIPLDLFLGGAYLLLLDVALLRGMDYADTTTLVKFVDGTRTISARTLADPGG